jgi:hypothetical protein
MTALMTALITALLATIFNGPRLEIRIVTSQSPRIRASDAKYDRAPKGAMLLKLLASLKRCPDTNRIRDTNRCPEYEPVL